jgi:hypothetical protein
MYICVYGDLYDKDEDENNEQYICILISMMRMKKIIIIMMMIDFHGNNFNVLSQQTLSTDYQ